MFCIIGAIVVGNPAATVITSSPGFNFLLPNFYCLPGTSFTYRKDLIEQYCYYDESYRLAAEYPRYLNLLSKGVTIEIVSYLEKITTESPDLKMYKRYSKP